MTKMLAKEEKKDPTMNGSPLVPVEQLERTDDYVVCVWRRLMLLIWRDKASAHGVLRSRALFEQWVSHQGAEAAVLIVVPGRRTRAPDESTLAAMHRAARDPVHLCRGMATLVELEGSVATSIRGLMMRLHTINARKDAAHVFNSAAAAATWAATLLEDEEITAASLTQAIRVAREG